MEKLRLELRAVVVPLIDGDADRVQHHIVGQGCDEAKGVAARLGAMWLEAIAGRF
ncbi:hypothetical protein [Rhizobacter sp. SG703]|uniref:hypothetical protein n=1 Tax=Rhizobacter sp. SG703 TaxID=2587140 RepID=UPI001444B3D0|nr:hypothetical protein [Rhizobacter sp. SG703]NKI96595.1 hypothetical protein [Rhizobacter sp. SG703]